MPTSPHHSTTPTTTTNTSLTNKSNTTSPNTSELNSPTTENLNKSNTPTETTNTKTTHEIFKENAKRISQPEGLKNREKLDSVSSSTEPAQTRQQTILLGKTHTVKPVSHLGTGVGALLYSYLNPTKLSEANTINQFNINSPRISMSNLKHNSSNTGQADTGISSHDETTNRKSRQFKFLDSSAFSAFSKDKLKNLQDALAKHYTNEQLNQLG